MRTCCAIALITAVWCRALWAQGPGPQHVLLVLNRNSPVSMQIGNYYAEKRRIPPSNVCGINTRTAERIDRSTYEKEIAGSVRRCLERGDLAEKILYIVTTAGVPLGIEGSAGLDGTQAAVDSELTLLYQDLHGMPHALNGPITNPFFGDRRAAFTHPRFRIYLVTRLAGYDFNDVKAMIDRSLRARNAGQFVLDLRSPESDMGNQWLSRAVTELPAERVVVDRSLKVLTDQKGVIGYASWGSNDSNRRQRFLHYEWLPGAIMTEFVSTNARTFARPPDSWQLGNWNEPAKFFAGAPQTMTADYIHEGATGASGHTAEPFLQYTPRPDMLLPAYYSGRNLAESYYLAIPALSWQNIVLGDPLCSLGKP